MNKASNINSLVFHISKISKSWNIQSPYPTALRNLLLGNIPKKKAQNLRVAQDYHFISKIIDDELRKDRKETKQNCGHISNLITLYQKNKDSSQGDKIINFLFHIFLMNLLDFKEHFKFLDKDEIKKFLESHMTSDSELNKFRSVLLLSLGNVKCNSPDKSKDMFGYSLDLLYLRILLSNEKTRDKKDLINYYLSQSFIEKLDFGRCENEKSITELLKSAIVIKAASGEGLYLPEPEKEQYLSVFAKELIRTEYIKNLKEATNFKIRLFKVINFSLPIWIGFSILFLIETIIILLPFMSSLFSAVNLPIISPIIDITSKLSNLPLWLIILINGIIMSFLLYLHQKYIYRKFVFI